MKTEEEIKQRIKELEQEKRNHKLNYLENEGILNAINIYAEYQWIGALEWVLNKE